MDGSSRVRVLLVQLALSLVAGQAGGQQPAVAGGVMSAGLFEHVNADRR
jgi:hypothetical protein